MITLAEITEYVQTLCPIVSIDSSGNIIFDQAATQQQKTAATAVIADWLIGVYPATVITESTVTNNWATVEDFISTLKVSDSLGNTYAANEQAMIRIERTMNTLLPTDTITWIEKWGNFSTNKAQLGEALMAANTAIQNKIKSTFGV